MNKILLFILLISGHALFAQDEKVDSLNNKPKKENFADDWAALTKYQKENELLPPPTRKEKRVVFLGSSIFEFWKQKNPEYFSRNTYVDRGISGQISPQLLIRFRQDVINLKPKAVIILAGSNDIAGNTGHVTIDKIMDNIKSMAELARLHRIKVILCKYLPVYEYPWNKQIKAADIIVDLNEKIETYAKERNYTILDYWTPLVDERKGQRAELTVDGVHPNLAGYKIMEGVTDVAIKKALKNRH
ncbi:GDSL-type esterase/lipase family protein [Pedobacter alluvionis]|uniref:Acylhydrolase n=1 Tax=Pedobacter alluvionis TaxID=475253 RepID=A0A497Y189_9SPHI|nr:GDSL-type esterase/lipase family protein [Pedobacter alluvionis]RLJ76631.1 lysophospholipase L1-like esterase [Pedobacter alluvionis]TFB34090.1 acylhydrolase [Pedobacter alluvionis]